MSDFSVDLVKDEDGDSDLDCNHESVYISLYIGNDRSERTYPFVLSAPHKCVFRSFRSFPIYTFNHGLNRQE